MDKRTVRQVLSLLFADLAGFSKISNDKAVETVNNVASEFTGRFLTPENHIYFNTWGDALYLVTADPLEMLELSLHLRDWYRNQNWRKKGIPVDLPIRIGVHAEKVNVVYHEDHVTDVIGTNVSATARIEPIVPPDSIYCTSIFKDLVSRDSAGFAVFTDVGDKELAKGFGTMRLYQVTRKHENVARIDPLQLPSNTPQTAFGFTVPRIRKTYSEQELLDFERNAFNYICQYFKRACSEMHNVDSDVSCDYEQIRLSKFQCRAFVKGNQAAQCQIWHVPDGFNRGIHYSHSIDENDRSYNESLLASSDGYSLSLTALGMLAVGNSQANGLSEDTAARYLWDGFVKQLER